MKKRRDLQMAKLLNKMLNLVGWEAEEDEEVLDEIQKVSAGIFLIAPNNVDIMGAEFKDELRSKGAFPWMKY